MGKSNYFSSKSVFEQLISLTNNSLIEKASSVEIIDFDF